MMRITKEPIQLTYDSFIETYGNGSYFPPPPVSCQKEEDAGDENQHPDGERNDKDDSIACSCPDKSSIGTDRTASNESIDFESVCEEKGSFWKKTANNMSWSKRHRIRKNYSSPFLSSNRPIKVTPKSPAVVSEPSDTVMVKRRERRYSLYSLGSATMQGSRKKRLSAIFRKPLLTRSHSTESGSSLSEGTSGSQSSCASPCDDRSPQRMSASFHPSNSFALPTYKGYLECRGKRRSWVRMWCVLNEKMLYCYLTPNSDSPNDVVYLQGYNVVADVKTLNRSRFQFRLQKKDALTYHLSCPNYRDFLLWVGVLEKVTRSSASADLNSLAACNARVHHPPTSVELGNSTDELRNGGNGKPSVRTTPMRRRPSLLHNDLMTSSDQHYLPLSSDPLNHSGSWNSSAMICESERQRLLDEIFDCQRQYQQETQILKTFSDGGDSTSGGRSPTSSDVRVPLHDVGGCPTMRRKSALTSASVENINCSFSNERTNQELKSVRHITQLRRRRNSIELKLDHYRKELFYEIENRLEPNSARMSTFDTKLKELKSALIIIDQLLEEEEAMNLHNIERLEQKRDLALLAIESCRSSTTSSSVSSERTTPPKEGDPDCNLRRTNSLPPARRKMLRSMGRQIGTSIKTSPGSSSSLTMQEEPSTTKSPPKSYEPTIASRSVSSAAKQQLRSSKLNLLSYKKMPAAISSILHSRPTLIAATSLKHEDTATVKTFPDSGGSHELLPNNATIIGNPVRRSSDTVAASTSSSPPPAPVVVDQRKVDQATIDLIEDFESFALEKLKNCRS